MDSIPEIHGGHGAPTIHIFLPDRMPREREKAQAGVVQGWGLTFGVKSMEKQEGALNTGSRAVSLQGEIGTG